MAQNMTGPAESLMRKPVATGYRRNARYRISMTVTALNRPFRKRFISAPPYGGQSLAEGHLHSTISVPAIAIERDFFELPDFIEFTLFIGYKGIKQIGV